MAYSSTISTVLLLITVINTAVVTAVPSREYNSLLSALRFRGYHVFANAICTTDIHSDILSGGNFTLFTPIDESLYDLDMTMSSADYTVALRFHIVPYRLTLPDLRQLPYGSNPFPTLVHGHEIHVVNPIPLSLPVMVEGVNVAFPGLYYDTNIAVHGLEGTIDFGSQAETKNSTSNLKNDVVREAHHPSPRNEFVSGVDTVGSPVPETSVVQSPDMSPAYGVSIPVESRRRQPVTQFDSISLPHEEHVSSEISPAYGVSIPVESRRRQPVTQFDSISLPHEEHVSSEISPAYGVSIPVESRRRQPVTQFDSISLPHEEHVSSEISPAYGVSIPMVTRRHQPMTRSESITQPREEHMSIEMRSDLLSQRLHASITHPRDEEAFTRPSEMNNLRIHDVSLAKKSTGVEDSKIRKATSELNSQGLRHVSLAVKSNDKHEKELTQVDDKVIDCPVAAVDDDQLKIVNIRHGDVFVRELYTPTRMSCADE